MAFFETSTLEPSDAGLGAAGMSMMSTESQSAFDMIVGIASEAPEISACRKQGEPQ